MPDIADQIEAALGATPPAPAGIDETLAAGRKAVRRRRLAYGVGAAATALVIGGTAWALSPGDGGERTGHPGFSGEPSASTRSDPSDPATTAPADALPWHGEAARVDRRGNLEVKPGWTVTEDLSTEDVTAVEVSDGARRRWYLFGDGVTFSPDGTAPGYDSFRAWVEVNIPILRDMANDEERSTPANEWPGVPRDDLVRWTADASTLEPLPGVELLDVRTPIDLGASFAPAQETAVASVRVDGEQWYVAAREPANDPAYLAVRGDQGGATLDAFVEMARARYAEGGGGLL